MLKKLLLAVLTLLIAPTLVLAEDFSQMNPTVQITSYKQLYTDQIIAFGSGSGTVISNDGLIVSNHHVIYDDNEQKPLDTFEICITFDVQNEPDCSYTARLMDHDKNLDIALLKINNKDIFNQSVTNLKYLDYQTDATPKEASEVQVIGYPGSGGDTITITKGQVSGYDTYNEYKYFKTDTDFDHGSSGGTALDSEGNFIGIPTYIRSYAENVGYFLDIREATYWINNNKSDKPIYNRVAENRLKKELSRLKNANKDLKLKYVDYPELSITLPEGWRFQEIEDDGFFAEQEKLTDPVGLSAYLNRYQYEIDEGYMSKVDEELAKIKERYPDYEQNNEKFNGYDALKVTYTYFNLREHAIYIPYGHTLISLRYSINLDEEEEQDEIIKEALDEIVINSDLVKTPDLDETITFSDPPFSITMPNNWRIQQNTSNQPMNLLAEAVQKDNYDGYIYIYYSLIPKDERNLSMKDRVDEETEYIGGSSKLIYKKEDVVMDGLEGYLYTYEYEGDDYQQMHKQLSLTLLNGNYEFTFYYDDLSDSFDSNLLDIQEMLNSFTFNGDEPDLKGQYDFGSLNYNFKDIQYHRFASAISDLADKGVVSGYSDGDFKPENLVTRSEALKIILESKNYLEEEKGLGKETDFDDYKYDKSSFKDISDGDWFKNYVLHAHENKIISGYGDGTFKPSNNVTLVEALKMIFGVYEIPVWQGETDPWYKKYMDKGYELYLIPRGIENPGQELTRAELTYIVNDVLNEASNSSGYYY